MNALILVDIQQDFLPGGALAVPDGDAVVPVANELAAAFDLVVATQDWHPRGHGSFASEHEGKEPFEEGELDGLPQTLWPDHCVQGSDGAAFAPGLDLRPVEAIFRKGMDPRIDSYSGFYDNDHRKSTGLAGYLKGRGVDTVYLVGLALDVCVCWTALDARKEGFATFVVEDGCRGLSDDDVRDALREMRDAGAKVVQSGDVPR